MRTKQVCQEISTIAIEAIEPNEARKLTIKQKRVRAGTTNVGLGLKVRPLACSTATLPSQEVNEEPQVLLEVESVPTKLVRETSVARAKANLILAIDVGKYQLEAWDGKQSYAIKPEQLASIVSKDVTMAALEHSGAYSKKVADELHSKGIKVFFVNTFKLKQYRDQVSSDVKTDKKDASLIHDYFQTFGGQRYLPNPTLDDLKEFLKLRTFMVQSILTWKSMLESSTHLGQVIVQTNLEQNIHRFKTEVDRIDKVIEKAVSPELKKVVGPLLALKMIAMDPSRFSTSKKFASYLGLKLRTYESGTIVKKRRINKRGDSHARSLLYMAAMKRLSMKKEPYFSFFHRLKDKGKPGRVCMTAVMNKMARHFWAAYQKEVQNGNSTVPKMQ